MTIAGIWKNEYGSTMSLDVTGNQVFGVYQSSTGSTGKYVVTGWQAPGEPTTSGGQPVAISIEWHSVDPGPEDPSWHWTSALGGQISLDDGAEMLTLSHLMVASDDFPGLTKAGVYLDKLNYHRVSSKPQSVPDANPSMGKKSKKSIEDPIDGVWQAEDGTTLSLQVNPEPQNRFGFIEGSCTGRFGSMQVSGLTDINASSAGLSAQATSLALLSNADGAVISLGGLLDLRSGKLDLQVLVNRETDPKATYVQTEIVAMRFLKV
jgi:hypothetical protein